MEKPLQQLFNAMPWVSWEPAELEGPILYIRGAKKLHIPDSWRDFVPAAI